MLGCVRFKKRLAGSADNRQYHPRKRVGYNQTILQVLNFTTETLSTRSATPTQLCLMLGGVGLLVGIGGVGLGGLLT
jgi:hypothetical protein